MTSDKMKERQKARRSGRYAKMNYCEVCGRPVGGVYASLPDAGQTGVGLVICDRCANWSEETIIRLLRKGRDMA